MIVDARQQPTVVNWHYILGKSIVPLKRNGQHEKIFKVSIFPCLLIHYYVLVLCSGFDVLSSAGNQWG